MPNAKISELPAASNLTGAEIFPLVQGGTTVRATAANLAGYLSLGRAQALPYTLAASDRGYILALTTSGGTLTVPAVGTLGGAAQILLINESAGNITINGVGNDVVLASSETATLVEVNSKQWVVRGPATLIS